MFGWLKENLSPLLPKKGFSSLAEVTILENLSPPKSNVLIIRGLLPIFSAIFL